MMTSFPCPEDGELSDDMKIYYNENGFLILNNFLSDQQADDLVEEGKRLISELFPKFRRPNQLLLRRTSI
jgi:hypothetical protein